MTIGLDISTACVGISLFDDQGKLMKLSYIKFKQDTLFKKFDQFIKHMDDKGYSNMAILHISIEEALKRFQGKFSNADTIQKLTAFNSMISVYMYKQFNQEPRYYNVNTARKIVFPELKIPKAEKNKKYLIWEAFVYEYPQINWVYSKRTRKLSKENFDMVDAYVAGMADIVTQREIAKSLAV